MSATDHPDKLARAETRFVTFDCDARRRGVQSGRTGGPGARVVNDAGENQPDGLSETGAEDTASTVCPVCGAPLLHEKCKLVCRSERCVYRIVFNCAEF